MQTWVGCFTGPVIGPENVTILTVAVMATSRVDTELRTVTIRSQALIQVNAGHVVCIQAESFRTTTSITAFKIITNMGAATVVSAHMALIDVNTNQLIFLQFQSRWTCTLEVTNQIHTFMRTFFILFTAFINVGACFVIGFQIMTIRTGAVIGTGCIFTFICAPTIVVTRLTFIDVLAGELIVTQKVSSWTVAFVGSRNIDAVM